MFSFAGPYWPATRHPWSCVLFVLPLLVIYEVGLYFLGPMPVEPLRSGADQWLRSGLAAAGIAPLYGAPVILLLILLAWALFYRENRPSDPLGVWMGMAVESAIFAAVLFGVSRGLWPWFRSLGGMLEGQNVAPSLAAPLAIESMADGRPTLATLVRYCGAGIYEETLFRLLFFSALLAACNLAELPRLWSIALAALGSALFFAGAHNLGPQGEVFHGSLFLFRTLAGLFFAWLYCVRGFGIAVGAHAGYDVLVSLFSAAG
jgi:hypothetical protein